MSTFDSLVTPAEMPQDTDGTPAQSVRLQAGDAACPGRCKWHAIAARIRSVVLVDITERMRSYICRAILNGGLVPMCRPAVDEAALQQQFGAHSGVVSVRVLRHPDGTSK